MLHMLAPHQIYLYFTLPRVEYTTHLGIFSFCLWLINKQLFIIILQHVKMYPVYIKKSIFGLWFGTDNGQWNTPKDSCRVWILMKHFVVNVHFALSEFL